MKNKSSAVIVLDASGKVLFAKDGPLSETEVENTIKLIDQHMI
jgi:predicted transcriptional regulator